VRKFLPLASLIAVLLLLGGAWWYIGHVNDTHPAIWPMVAGDAGRHNQAKTSFPTKEPRVLWSHPVAAAHISPVVGVDGTIYVADAQDLTALDPNGEVRWRWKGKGQIMALALGRQGSVYMHTDAELLAFSPTGGLLWTTAHRTESANTLIVGQGGVLYSEGDRQLDAFRDDGKHLWKFAHAGVTNLLTEARDGQILFGTGATLYAVGRNGDLAWKRTDLVPRYLMAMPNGTTYVLDQKSGNVFLVDKTGQTVLQDSDRSPLSGVALGDKYLQIGALRKSLSFTGIWPGAAPSSSELVFPVVDRKGNVLLQTIKQTRGINIALSLRDNKGKLVWQWNQPLASIYVIPYQDGRLLVFGQKSNQGQPVLMAIGD
jgi:hypothetical protein